MPYEVVWHDSKPLSATVAMQQENTGPLADAGGVIIQVMRFGRSDWLNTRIYKSWHEQMMRLLHLLDQSQSSKSPQH